MSSARSSKLNPTGRNVSYVNEFEPDTTNETFTMFVSARDNVTVVSAAVEALYVKNSSMIFFPTL